VKSPAVIHLKCLDTFALRGVARSFGAGAAGVRLTREGLEIHTRPSRHRPDALPRAPEESTTEARSEREASADTLAPHATPIVLPPPTAPRPSMPSHVTIEMGLRRPTTWAVLLLSLGVSFGVVIARVASESVATEPHAASAAVAPPSVVEAVVVPRTVRTALPPAVPSPSAFTIASTTIIGRPHRHSHHGAAGVQARFASPLPEVAPPAHADPTVPAAPAAAPSTTSTSEDTENGAPEAKGDGGDTASATAASEQVRRELSASLGTAHPTAR
jgi:hypothetical protein